MGKKQRQERKMTAQAQAQAPQPREPRNFAIGPEPVAAGEKFPVPSYAAEIWLTSEGLRVALPPQSGEKGHSVLLPLKEASFGVLLQLLHERRKAPEAAGGEAFAYRGRAIGTKAAPVQYDIEAMLRAFGSAGGAIRRIEKPKPTQLSDLGLD